jgi:hypothetical protein
MPSDGQDKDNAIRQSGFDRLQANQPAVYMDYSPTRTGIKFFADKWGKDPNKLSYVYLTNQDGAVEHYVVLKGLPISYCAQMLPPQVRDSSSSYGSVVIPAPGVDGAYYGGNGGCDQYYGIDATTNGYVEWTQRPALLWSQSNQLVGRRPTVLTRLSALRRSGRSTGNHWRVVAL